MWLYVQDSGDFSHDGLHVDTGYSGYSIGKNNPAAQEIESVGPIPCGMWTIAGLEMVTPKHGPYVLLLEPQEGTRLYGRSAFRIHGDSEIAPGEASRGCIVLDRGTREQVWDSGDRVLRVVSLAPPTVR